MKHSSKITEDMIDAMRSTYGVYGKMEAFDVGFLNYLAGNLASGEIYFPSDSADRQAYDRGMEAAMRLDRKARGMEAAMRLDCKARQKRDQ